jgi:uncharacterized protein YutE (UPF0331/DUF86 family)
VARLRIISKCVSALREFAELSLDEFLGSFIVCTSAERNLQVAIQAALDIGASLLAEAGADVPAEYREIFPSLAELGILPHDLAERMVNMAKFRNVLVHLYAEIDLERLYGYIQTNLDDFDRFGESITRYLSGDARVV